MKSKTKGIVVSFVVHVTIIVLLILFGFSTPLPLPGEQGILINFGTDEVGSGLREPRPSPREQVQQVQQTPDRDEQASLTQDFEEAPSVPEVKPDPVKPKEEEAKPEEKPKEEIKPEEEKPRELDRRTLFPGQKTDGDTSDEGSTGNQGNQGDTQGSTDSQNREGGTVSGGDGISFSLDGRTISNLVVPEYPNKETGKVVVKVWVDINGNVTNVSGPEKGSTNYDGELVNAAKAAARQTKFNISKNAQAQQTGTITYVFKQQ